MSIRASKQAIQKAKQALIQKGLKQTDLPRIAKEKGLSLSSQPISFFFTGKEVADSTAEKIRLLLELTWEVEDLQFVEKQEQQEEQTSLDIDALVQAVRERHYEKVLYQCETMRMLDISQPITLSDIYTDVNILEEITSQQWLEISDLLQEFNPESDDFDRLGLGKRLRRLPGLNAVLQYSKLMVLGKPGSGKTTFLQWVAIKCNSGEFQPNQVPIFIRLKNFVEDAKKYNDEFKLLNYIVEDFSNCGVSQQVIESILIQGRALILLDGLDEASDEEGDETIRQIRKFTDKYFKNQIIITCRIAARSYKFQSFTDVEVADFNQQQVESFAHKWFSVFSKESKEQKVFMAIKFLEKLNLPENRQIRELAVTPILLNLTCLVFAAKAAFPSNRAELYKQGIDILLVKWDKSRGITRDEVYQQLSLTHKVKLLSQVASTTFEQSKYFLKQGEIQQLIADFLAKLSDSQNDLETLYLNSEAVLKAIEAQHGLLVERAREIYSFSHLTFQEYFAARELIASFDPKIFKRKSRRNDFMETSSNIGKKSWREVFLLAAGMMRNADSLLQSMKQRIDNLISRKKKLQEFITWVYQKSLSVEVLTDKPASIRAFYFTLIWVRLKNRDLYWARKYDIDSDLAQELNLDLSLIKSIDNVFDCNLELETKLDMGLILCLERAATLTKNPYLGRNLEVDIHRAQALTLALDMSYKLALELEATQLGQSLRQLKAQLPHPSLDLGVKRWWRTKGTLWVNHLRAVIIECRNIGHDWQFKSEEKRVLEQYYNATKLVIDCLHSDCEVTDLVRQQIENTLLLPSSEIKRLEGVVE